MPQRRTRLEVANHLSTEGIGVPPKESRFHFVACERATRPRFEGDLFRRCFLELLQLLQLLQPSVTGRPSRGELRPTGSRLENSGEQQASQRKCLCQAAEVIDRFARRPLRKPFLPDRE